MRHFIEDLCQRKSPDFVILSALREVTLSFKLALSFRFPDVVGSEARCNASAERKEKKREDGE